MSDPIANKIAEQAANQAAQQGGGGGQAQADPSKDAQAKFEEALNRPEEAQNVDTNQTAQEADKAQQISPIEDGSVEAKPTIGDAILEGVEKMKSSYDARVEEIQTRIVGKDGKELSVEDAMKLQFEIMQMGLEQDLTGKVADKTSQGVQTMFRPQ